MSTKPVGIDSSNNFGPRVEAALLTRINARITSALTAFADVVKSKAGVGGLVIIRDGIDTPTGAANEIILTVATETNTNYRPPGLDLDGGQVGSSMADPAIAIAPRYDSAATTDPYRTDTESQGTVLVLGGGYACVAVRCALFDPNIDKVTWQIGDGSGASVAGQVAIVNPATGAVLAFTSMNLTPGTVTATVGNTMSWTLSGAGLNDLALKEVIVVFALGSGGGTVRFSARGISNLINPTSLRLPVPPNVGNPLNRSGGLALSGPITSGTVFDFSTGATGWSWTKRPVPALVLSRTS